MNTLIKSHPDDSTGRPLSRFLTCLVPERREHRRYNCHTVVFLGVAVMCAISATHVSAQEELSPSICESGDAVDRLRPQIDSLSYYLFPDAMLEDEECVRCLGVTESGDEINSYRYKVDSLLTHLDVLIPQCDSIEILEDTASALRDSIGALDSLRTKLEDDTVWLRDMTRELEGDTAILAERKRFILNSASGLPAGSSIIVGSWTHGNYQFDQRLMSFGSTGFFALGSFFVEYPRELEPNALAKSKDRITVTFTPIAYDGVLPDTVVIGLRGVRPILSDISLVDSSAYYIESGNVAGDSFPVDGVPSDFRRGIEWKFRPKTNLRFGGEEFELVYYAESDADTTFFAGFPVHIASAAISLTTALIAGASGFVGILGGGLLTEYRGRDVIIVAILVGVTITGIVCLIQWIF